LIVRNSNGSYSAISTVAGNAQCAIATTTNQTGIKKLAFAYKVDDFAFYDNSSQVGVDTSGTVPTCNEIQIGRNGAATSVSWIRSVALFPTRLANATLASITA
jgi:hypothetical protein